MTKTTTPKRTQQTACYLRYSSTAQDEGCSLELQLDACKKAAGTNDLLIYQDAAKTGRAVGGRDGLLRLLEDARGGRIQKVYLYKYSRLGRAAETHVICQELEDLGIQIISCTEGDNRLARSLHLTIASEYSHELGDNTRAGLMQRFRERRWTGGMPPYGFKVTEQDKIKKIAIDDTEAAIIRSTIIPLYLNENHGCKAIARKLTEQGIPTRKGGESWGHVTVKAILSNQSLILDKACGEARGQFDFILLDTPPNPAATTTIAAYSSADWFLLSVFPHPLSLGGLNEAFKDIADVRARRNPRLEVMGVLLNAVDARTRLWQEVAQVVEAALANERRLDGFASARWTGGQWLRKNQGCGVAVVQRRRR